MKIYKILKNIWFHPLNQKQKIKGLYRFFWWQFRNRITNKAYIHSFTTKTKLSINKGMHAATGHIYCGLYEWEDMLFTLLCLRKDDLFIDAGANIGAYTILASGHIGAETYSFEPIKSTYQLLQKNIELNSILHLVSHFNLALGDMEKEMIFTTDLGQNNHVVDNSFTNITKVKCVNLDQICKTKRCPFLIKIDVEGYETQVVNGMKTLLLNPELSAIIIELNGLGKRYNFDESLIHDILVNYEFIPYHFDPFKRKLTEIKSFSSRNTIYIKNLKLVTDRINEAKKITIFGNVI